MVRRHPALTAVITISLLVMGLVLAGIPVQEGLGILGLLFVLILPGYALTAALFAPGILDAPEHITIAIGLSISAAAIGGFVLNLTPWGLRASSWAMFLGSISLGSSVVGLSRRRGAPMSRPLATTTRPKRRRGKAFLVVAAVLVTAGSIMVAYRGAATQRYPEFTQLWIQPPVDAGHGSVRIGVRSMEAAPRQYKLRLEVDDAVVREWSSITLNPGGTWETTVVLPVRRASVERIDALLYRLDRPADVYRRVELWGGNEVNE